MHSESNICEKNKVKDILSIDCILFMSFHLIVPTILIATENDKNIFASLSSSFPRTSIVFVPHFQASYETDKLVDVNKGKLKSKEMAKYTIRKYVASITLYCFLESRKGGYFHSK